LIETLKEIAVAAPSSSRPGVASLTSVDKNYRDVRAPCSWFKGVAAELKRRRTGTRVVIVTTFARTGYLRRALEAGASGYLLKDMRAEELAEAVRRVHQGLRVIHPELATEAWGELRGKVWPAETLPGN
jgi:two-component system response regulator DesR